MAIDHALMLGQTQRPHTRAVRKNVYTPRQVEKPPTIQVDRVLNPPSIGVHMQGVRCGNLLTSKRLVARPLIASDRGNRLNLASRAEH